MPDLEKIGGCSTLIVEPNAARPKPRCLAASSIGRRTRIWPEFTLVTVYKSAEETCLRHGDLPRGSWAHLRHERRRACRSHQRNLTTKDKSPKSDLKGVPMLMLFRKLLEECTTVEDVEKMLKETAAPLTSASPSATRKAAVFSR